MSDAAPTDSTTNASSGSSPAPSPSPVPSDSGSGAPKPARIPMCSLCRVNQTEEHVASGWHAFNQRLFSSGRMPIAETNYNLYEKPKEDAAAGKTDGGSSSSAAAAAAGAPSSSAVPVAAGGSAGSTRNVNAWHWEEADYSRWAKVFITEQLMKIALGVPVAGEAPGSITVTEVAKISGDAYVNTRKGKTFSGYEFKITIEWKGTQATSTGTSD